MKAFDFDVNICIKLDY